VQITSLGHAGLRVETSRAAILIDPWFAPDGTFQAAWFQFPENAHLLHDDLSAATAVVISHEHPDHVDPWFLRRLPVDVPVMIPRYPSPVLGQKLSAAGRSRVIEVDSWRPVSVADGLSVFFVSEESPMNHDSAIVAVGDGRVLLNLNDARLTPRQFREVRRRVGGRIDVFSAQGSGASWHPIAYEMPEARKREISREKRLAKFAYFAAAVRLLEPGVTLPFAGPPCFLDPEVFEHNDEMEEGGIFPDQGQVSDWLRGQGLTGVEVLLPGDAWAVDPGAKIPDPTWRGFSFLDRWDYLKEYAERKRDVIASVKAAYPQPRQSLWESFRAYFERLLAMSPYFNRRIGMRVGFDIEGSGGGQWAVDFRPDSEGVRDEMRDCGYTYRFASRWLPTILSGRVHWEDFLLTMRFRAARNPDEYNDHLLGLLKFAEPESLRKVEEYETTARDAEVIGVEAGGRVYEAQRFCPHAGGDLEETGEILPGRRLRCLNHYFEFDLETGRCLNGNVGPLRVRRVR
jgi:UDP-MurNAc hydroxylase